MNLQGIIQAEAKRQGLSGYRIAKMAGLPMRTVQLYLAGDSDLAGARIDKIMAALGLKVRTTKRVRRKTAGGK